MGIENKNSFMEVLEWRMSYPDGFYGILRDPLGENGFLSRSGGATCWTAIGDGQDAVEVMMAAKALHDAIDSGNTDPELLGHLGSEVERLSNPKPKD